MTINEVFDLLMKFKTYPELDMMVTLKYGVDFLHIYKKAAKCLGFVINEFTFPTDNDQLVKILDHMCNSYKSKHNIVLHPIDLQFEI